MISSFIHPPGGAWLYLKIFGGPQALEEWLTGSLRDFLHEWFSSRRISLFYFIRFLDRDYHLRLRLRLTDPMNSAFLLSEISASCREMLDEERIWKIEAGTYLPEIERYGAERIELIEEWFGEDSLFWLDTLAEDKSGNGSDIWKKCICRADWILDGFGFPPEKKLTLLRQMRNGLLSEFGIDHHMKSRLDVKYRNLSSDVTAILSHQDSNTLTLTGKYSQSASTLGKISETLTKAADPKASDPKASDIISDLIHMSLNRAFRTRHRLQELVVYDFMARGFESLLARIAKRDA